MTHGLSVDGFDFDYGTYSVITKGQLTATTTLTKGHYPDVTEFKVVFIATGMRNTYDEEVRPYYSETSATITMTKPTDAGEHQYLVLGR
jgi:hypothetical protein